MYHLYKFPSSNAATSTEQPAQLVNIVADPSLQNPDHFPQVEWMKKFENFTDQ